MSLLPSRLSLRGACALSALCIAALASPPAEAQWKWRDKNDRVQYSDTPPPSSVPESAILQRPQGAGRRGAPSAPQFAPAPASEAAIPASGPVRTADPELEARRKKAEQEEAAKKKAGEERLAAARAENCARARAQLRTLDDGVRMARVNAKGEREVLDDNARVEEARRSREVVALDCK